MQKIKLYAQCLKSYIFATREAAKIIREAAITQIAVIKTVVCIGQDGQLQHFFVPAFLIISPHDR